MTIFNKAERFLIQKLCIFNRFFAVNGYSPRAAKHSEYPLTFSLSQKLCFLSFCTAKKIGRADVKNGFAAALVFPVHAHARFPVCKKYSGSDLRIGRA